MKKRILSLLLAVSLLLGLFPAAAFAASGSTEIGTAEELAALGGKSLSGDYVLTADIDMSGVDMSPISNLYQGTFDGGGFTISNLSLSGSGDTGLFASLSANACVTGITLENCTVSNTSGSYAGVGALVGKINGSGCVIENCGVSGGLVESESSSSLYVGGLVGYVYNSASIENCFSTAAVSYTGSSSSSRLGGLLGYVSSGSTSVENCYSRGSISATAGYVGGLAGYLAGSYSGRPTFSNCYTAAELTASSEYNAYPFAYRYGNYVTFENCYYDSDVSAADGAAGDSSFDGLSSQTTEELKNLATTLGSAYQDDLSSPVNGGYPILKWQNPNAAYSVTLNVTPVDAKVTWDGTEQEAKADGVYTFSDLTPKSSHTYKVEQKDNTTDYAPQEGTITVGKADVVRDITLAVNEYDLTFTLEPNDAELTLRDSEGLELTPETGSDTVFSVPNGTYSYQVEKFGYETTTGTVEINRAAATESVTLTAQPVDTVTFAYGTLPEGGTAVDGASLSVTTEDGTQIMESAAADSMFYQLPVGYLYIYTFKSKNYSKVTGTIDLTGETAAKAETVTLPLTIKTAWGGADDILAPSVGDGSEASPYEISTGAELAWLAQEVNKSGNARTNFHVVLTKDIDLSDEPWTPIGSNYSTRYACIFDGAGHTISGLNVTGTSSGNYGLFGYVEDGMVKDLTVKGTVEVTGNGSSSYGIGGVVGYFGGRTDGEILRCVSEVDVTGSQNVGGIIGYISDGYSANNKKVEGCINRGAVTSTGNKAGGLVGYVSGPVTIENCYNTGTVSGGGWYSGGITASLSSSAALIRNCYTKGTVEEEKNGAYPAFGQKSSGTVENIFYLSSLGTDSNATGVTESELKAVPEGLGAAFLPGGMKNNGYPILDFEVAKYAVTFTLNTEDAQVSVTGDGASYPGTQNGAVWTFQLPAGSYHYTVSGFGYVSQDADLTMESADIARTITLTEAAKKTVSFRITFNDNNPTGAKAEVTVLWNGEPVPQSASAGGSDPSFELPYGDYTYTVKAKGYAKVSAGFTVNEGSENTIAAALEPSKAWDGAEKEQPSGSGTPEAPYEISTGAELAWLADHVDQSAANGSQACAILTDDVDLGGYPWTPIGNSYSYQYKSGFDGKGYTVSGLKVEGQEYAGLFGYASNASIKNLTVSGTVSGGGYAGGILGYAKTGCTVENCGSQASVTASGYYAGGVIGEAGTYGDKTNRISGCYNMGTVTGSTGSYGYAGGILAYDNGETEIQNCYNTGDVSGKNAGGIRGNLSGSAGAITNCYNTGAIDGTSAGSIVPGSNNTLTNCYYLDSGTDTNSSGSTPKALGEMTSDDFAALLNAGQSGAAAIWKRDDMTNNGLPILSWQKTAKAAETDTPVTADADFVWSQWTDPETGELFGEITPVLRWTPMDGVSAYTVILWSEYFAPKENVSGETSYIRAEEKVLTLTDVTEISDGKGGLTLDLEDTLENLNKQKGDRRYYAVVTAAGEPLPSAKYMEDEIFGYQDPYNRMGRITGLHWEGTKACWDAKDAPYFDENCFYTLTIYKKNSDGTFDPGTSLDVTPAYHKVDCGGYFAAGGTYAFTVTAVGSEQTTIFGLTDSLPSRLSSDPENGGEADGIYTVPDIDVPGGEYDETWTPISTAQQWMELAGTKDELTDPHDPDSNLQKIAWGKKYYLTADLDFSDLPAEYETKTKSLGNVTNRFMGTLSGNGHKITGLTLSNYDSGLFWYIGSTGCVYDLTIEGANILVSDNAAVLAHNNFGLIEDCAVINSNITADTGAAIGGLVSRNYGVIRDSFVEGGVLNSGSPTATGHGGFVGANEEDALIERCWTSMEVKTLSEHAGGFVGLGYGGTIRDCFALGNVSARGYSGGFVGRSVYNGNVYENCYAAGTVTVTGQEVHGFIGGNKPDSAFQYDQSEGITNCYYNAASLSDSNGAAAKTLEEMGTDAFKDALNTRGEEIWARLGEKNDGLPYLKAVKAPEKPQLTDLTVELALAVYDKETYTFSQKDETISVTFGGNGNTRVEDVLDAAQAQGLLTYSYDTTPTFGRYIHTINGYAVEAPDGWMFTINDELSNVSASLATVKNGDRILWYEGTTENRFLPPKWDELSGTALEWVEIKTAEELRALASGDDAALAKNYRLAADIDLSGESFPGIGSTAHPFTGIFDGQGHTVSGATITGTTNVGFFNALAGATVKNLNLTGLSVKGQTNVGGLAGWAQASLDKSDMGKNEACLIGNCTVSGAVEGTTAVGGLVGLNDGKYDNETQFSIAGSVHKCAASVEVTGSGTDQSKLGGLVGDNQGSITESAASGNVNASAANIAGGLCGRSNGDIYDSHAEGDVTASGTAGGFAGSSDGEVKRCYSLGSVTGTDNVGSFAGALYAADYVIGAGKVTASGAKGGLAGSLSGTLVGVESQITVKDAYGNCADGLNAIGNTSSYQSEGNVAALEVMKLSTVQETANQLYKMFGVNMKVPGSLEEEAAKYEQTLLVSSSTAAGTPLSLLKQGQSAGSGFTVTYEADSEYLTAGDSLILAKQNDTAGQPEIPVTIVITDENGNSLRKSVKLILQQPSGTADSLMDAIASTLTESSDGWTVMDMALYETLDGKTASTSETAGQNALNLLISEASGTAASAGDRARIEIVLRAMGVDSTRLYPVNGNEAVDNAKKLATMDLTAGGHYGVPYILLADLQGNLKLTDAQIDQLIDLLRQNQGADGLFGYEWDGVKYPDADTACAALAGLARFYDAKPAAKEIADRVIAALPGAMDEHGSLGSANSDAMAIIGLIAMGQDPAQMTAPSGASLIDGLLSYANAQGNGFLYYGQENVLATEQGFRALVALAKWNGTDPLNIYDFSKNEVAPGRATGAGEVDKPQEPSGTTDITVSFTLKADKEEWIPTTELTLKKGSTVYHAFTKALKDAGLTAAGAEKGYVRSITKDGVTLSEFDKGDGSGWLYKVNGKLPEIGMLDYTLSQGDEILWYYTADWTKDPQASGGISGGSAVQDKDDAVILTPEASQKGKTASAEVTEKEVKEAVEAVGKNGASQIIIRPATEDDVTKVTVKVPEAALKDVAAKKDCALTFDTVLGGAALSASGVSELSKKNGGDLTVSFEALEDPSGKNGGGTKVEVKLGSQAIQRLDSGLAVAVNAEQPGNGDVLAVAEEDGSVTIVRKSIVSKDAVTGIVDGSCTVKVVDNSKDFADVDGHWAEESIAFAASHELFSGVGQDRFAPDNGMSRAMLASVLYQLEGAPAGEGTNRFSDVRSGAWYEDAVLWADSQGIAKGYGNGSFGPNRLVTREQLAVMLYQYAKTAGMNVSAAGKISGFADAAQVSGWSSDAMGWAVGAGLISGKPGNRLDPKGTATRAEMASILQKLITLMVEQTSDASRITVR